MSSALGGASDPVGERVALARRAPHSTQQLSAAGVGFPQFGHATRVGEASG